MDADEAGRQVIAKRISDQIFHFKVCQERIKEAAKRGESAVYCYKFMRDEDLYTLRNRGFQLLEDKEFYADYSDTKSIFMIVSWKDKIPKDQQHSKN